MYKDRYFVERCKNLPRKQRQTILLLECRVQIFRLSTEDYTLGIQNSNLLPKGRRLPLSELTNKGC